MSIYNVKSPDDLLGKGCDGQPLHVVYGAKIATADPPKYVWTAYDQTDSGKRLARGSHGGVCEFDAVEFSKQLPRK
jgi:hypothetical protein